MSWLTAIIRCGDWMDGVNQETHLKQFYYRANQNSSVRVTHFERQVNPSQELDGVQTLSSRTEA